MRIYLRKMRLYFVVCCEVSENKETRVWNEVIDSQVYVVERAKTMFQNWQDIGRICDTYCNSDKKKM